ncbi:MAG: hypothetical protein ACRDBQ_19090 [Shewanella sp.]
MKDDFHLAFRRTCNFPLAISIYDSVEAHVKDNLRLISMLPWEWPKVRGKELNARYYKVDNEYKVGKHTVKHIRFIHRELTGHLVDEKYFLTDDVLGMSLDLELMLTPFNELGAKPVVTRDWNSTYMSSCPLEYRLVDTAETELENYHEIRNYAVHGIDNLLDLMSFSYKFSWDYEHDAWVAIEDEHEITQRIRKPWMQFLTQKIYGETPASEADLAKVVSFLMTKVNLTEEEAAVCQPIIERGVTLDDLRRVASRQSVLNDLLRLYKSPELIVTGTDIRNDPFFAFAYQYAKEAK